MARLHLPAPLRPALLAASTALLCAWSAPALATEATVPPLVGSGVDPLIVLNMTSLISSEMDFMGEFDGVTQLDKRPASLDARCLGSASCLGGIAAEGGTSAVVAGAVASKGNKFDLYLVYYNDGRIVRTKEYTLVNVPSVIADSMGGYIRELVTGESPAAQAAGAAGTVDADFFEDEEDEFAMAVVPTGGNSRRIPTSSSGGGDELDGFDFDADPEQESREKRAEEERQRAAALAAQRDREAAEQRRREELERQKAEEDERRRAAAIAAQRQREEEERQAAAAAQAEEPEEEDDDLVFGAADITFAAVPMELEDERPSEDEDDDRGGVAMLGLDDDPGRSSMRDREPRERVEREPRERKEREPRERPEREPRERKERSDYRDLDNSSSRTKARSDDGEAPTAVAAARIGYASFQGLSFVTYGAEVSFLATDHLAILGGVEAYSTKRAMPEELQERGAPPEVWNTILPFNLGLAYRFLTGSIQPYAGGDFVMIPGYVKDTGGLATGLRIRGGSDFLVTDSFGFNLNLSMGMWAGRNFEEVATDSSNAALTPQFSGGTVLHF